MKTIEAAEFREQYLELLDHLDAEELVITKHGRPVARVIPYAESDGDLIGSLRHKIKATGDIYSTGLRPKGDAQS